MLSRIDHKLFAVALAVSLPFAANACEPSFGASWDKRIKYAADGSFVNQDKYSGQHGDIPVPIGRSRVVQIITEGFSCGVNESVVITDCENRSSIQIHGKGEPEHPIPSDRYAYIGGFSANMIQYHLEPRGTVDVFNGKVPFEVLLKQAATEKLEVEADFVSTQQELRRKNRIDPFRMCEHFFPEISNDNRQGG